MLLKQKLYISLIAAIAVPLITSTYLFSSSVKNQAIDKLNKIELPMALASARNALELKLSAPIYNAQAIATNSFVQHWLASGESVDKIPTYVDYLAKFKQQTQVEGAFIASLATKNYYTDRGHDYQVSKDDAWFYDFINSDKKYEISIGYEPTQGTTLAYINYIIEVDGARIAMGGVSRTLAAMTDLIKQYKIGQSGLVYLVDNQGEVKFHPDKDLIGSKIDLPAIVSGQFTNITKDRIISSTPLTLLDWHLVAEVSEQEIYQPINDAINQNIIFGGLILLCGIALVRLLAIQIFKPIEQITSAVTLLAAKDGDLTTRLPIGDNNEMSDLAQQLNLFLEYLHVMFKQVAVSSLNVKSLSQEVNRNILNAAELVEQQSTSTLEVAQTVEQLEMTVQDISDSATNTTEVATSSQETTIKGSDYVNNTIDEMSHLEHSMSSTVQSVIELSDEIESIAQVLDIIKAISDQTNLLALNAAIEAARAGEQGRGFAVVADEVRVLARRTAESTEQINSTILSLKNKAQTTVSAIEGGSERTGHTSVRLNETGQTLAAIASEIQSITQMSGLVVTASHQHMSATNEIKHNIGNISESAVKTQDNIKNSSLLCIELADESSALDSLIGKLVL